MHKGKDLSYKNKAVKEGEQNKGVAINSIIFAKNTIFLGVTVGLALTYSSSTYAENINKLENKSDASVVVLQTSTVEDIQDKNPMVAGTNGQILETNHIGLLGDKDILDTPFNAISYTDRFIQDQQAIDISDVITATDPSIYRSGVSGENLEYYYIRGFASNSNDVTVNGLAGMAPYYRSSPEMYERIDVLKGPSAMLNGMSPSGSLGGSVNLVTKRATEEPLTRLTTKYLSESQLGGNLDVSRRFGEDKQFGVRVNGAYLNGDSTVKTQEKENELGAIALDWRGERVRASLDLYHTDEHVNAPSRGITLADGVALPSALDTDSILNPSWAYYNTKTEGAITRGEFDISDQFTAYATTGITKWNYAGLSAGVAEVTNSEGDLTTTLGYVGDDNKRTSMEIGGNGTFQTGSIGHQIATNATRYIEDYNLYAKYLSGSYFTNIYELDWGAAPELDLDVPLLLTTETTLSSVGIADTLSFADDKYQLTVGARYQQVITEQTGGLFSLGTKYDESAITPSVALLVKLADRISAYANYSEGLSQGGTAPTTADNSGDIFAPYKTKQKEIGIKFGSNFTHTVSLYEIAKPNAYTDGDTNIYGYYGEQRNRGIEWGFFGTPVESLRLMGGLTYIDAEITSSDKIDNIGNQAAGVSKWQAKLGTEWDIPSIKNLTIIVNANYSSKQYLENDNAQSLDGHTILGLGARYTTYINETPVTIRANIDNLTDKSYWAAARYNDLSIGEGRTMILSATIDF